MKSENFSQCERNSAHNVGNKSKRRHLISLAETKTEQLRYVRKKGQKVDPLSKLGGHLFNLKGLEAFVKAARLP